METLQQRLKYITENLDILQNDDEALWKTVEQITEHKLSEYIGFYPRESRFFGRSLFDLRKSFNWNAARFDEWLKKNYDGNKNLFLAYANNNSLFWHYYFRKSGDHYTISDIHYADTNLFGFLRYVILKKQDPDFGIAADIAKEFRAAGNDLKDIHILDENGELVQKISVKAFKNGRLDIKGLNPGQKLFVDRMIENKRISHINPNWDNVWGNNN